MNLLAALLIADNVRQRAEQCDCPTIPAQPTETLEEVVMELQRALARDAVAEAVVEVKKERDDMRAALLDAAHRVRWLMQFVTDTDPISAELAKWDALLAATAAK